MKTGDLLITWSPKIRKFQDAGLGIENLVAVAIDAIKVARAVYGALKDGVQFQDAFVLFNQFPAIQHVAEIAPTAFRELRDLTPQEAAAASQRIADGTGLPHDGTIFGKVRAALALSARTYKVVDDAVTVGHEWKNLFEATPALAMAA